MMTYLHGGDIYSQKIELDYSVNLSPLGLPKGVKQAAAAYLDQPPTYPDSQCRRLKQALASYHGIRSEEILCGNGAADLIFQLAEVLKAKKALLTIPSFQEYEQALKAAGTKILYNPLKAKEGFVLDPDRWIEQLDPSIDLAVLCNPNNPTGLCLSGKTVEKMADACRKTGTFLVVDECFTEFLDRPEEVSLLYDWKSWNHVFVLKAFTKLYAMAGLRLGYGICGDRELLSGMERIRQPWSVSGIAQAAGEAALQEREYVHQVQNLIRRERPFLKQGLEQLSFQVFDSQANYLFFYVPQEKEWENSLFDRAIREKILIRSCSNFQGLGSGYYRVCVKDRERNQRLLAVLQRCKEG